MKAALTEDYKNIIILIVQVEKLPFMYLTVDLPSQPLFRDDQQENIIPQVNECFIQNSSFFFMSFVLSIHYIGNIHNIR